ncbi:hypothetical protein MCEGE14_02567 [Burkholderiaceae bacterium]
MFVKKTLKTVADYFRTVKPNLNVQRDLNNA